MITKSDIKQYINITYNVAYDFDVVAFTEEVQDGEKIIRYTRTSCFSERLTDWIYLQDFIKIIRDKKLKRVI